MSDTTSQTVLIQRWIERLSEGDTSAREQLLNCSMDQLMRIARKIKRDFPSVERWERTDDVFQNAALRLWRALEEVELVDVRHFFRLAAMQIRRELIDMARHYHGAHGLGAHHATQATPTDDESRQADAFEQAELTQDPRRVAEWAEFHEAVEKLPTESRETFDLLWYHGLSQDEAASVLDVDVRTVKRRWRAARIGLHALLKGEPPGI